MSEVEPGFLVRGACGREWFVPLEAVGADYAEYLMHADGITAEEARAYADQNRKDWPIWFAEQCNQWGDVERIGRLVKKSTMFKTKKALDRQRGFGIGGPRYISDYEQVGVFPEAKNAVSSSPSI